MTQVYTTFSQRHPEILVGESRTMSVTLSEAKGPGIP